VFEPWAPVGPCTGTHSTETVELNALDVVEGLYGSHIADGLKNLLAEVGLGS
jgi:hypothetical protein